MDWKDDWDEKQEEKYQKREARREAQAKKTERQEEEREKRRQEDFQRKFGCKICGAEASPSGYYQSGGREGGPDTYVPDGSKPSNTVRCRKCKRYVCHNCCVETGETSLDQVLANTVFAITDFYTCKHCLGY